MAHIDSVAAYRYIEHIQQRSLTSPNLHTRSNKLQIRRDLNGPSRNLGRYTKRLGKRCLARLHASVASGNEHIERCDRAGPRGSGHLVAYDLLAYLFQVAVGEDEANITDEVGEDAIVFGVLVEECLDGTADLETLDFNRYSVGRGTYHCIFTHENNAVTA